MDHMSFEIRLWLWSIKVSFFYQCSKMQFITFQNFHIRTCFSQFLWFFSLKCWFKGQMMSKIHLSLPNAYKLMCFDRNVNGNRDVKFLECDKWSLHWYENLTLVIQNYALLSYLERPLVEFSLIFLIQFSMVCRISFRFLQKLLHHYHCWILLKKTNFHPGPFWVKKLSSLKICSFAKRSHNSDYCLSLTQDSNLSQMSQFIL